MNKHRIIFIDGTERIVTAESPTDAILNATIGYPELRRQVRTVLTFANNDDEEKVPDATV